MNNTLTRVNVGRIIYSVGHVSERREVIEIYQGDNQTALESQKLISNTFFELMKHKKYSEINIKEICEKAGVSRQTFYSLFETKENVIVYGMGCSCSHLKASYIKNGKISADVMSTVLADFIYCNYDFLKLLMDHGLICVLYDYFYNSFNECKLWGGMKDISGDILKNFFIGGMTGLIKSAVNDPSYRDKSQLRHIIIKLFAGDYLE